MDHKKTPRRSRPCDAHAGPGQRWHNQFKSHQNPAHAKSPQGPMEWSCRSGFPSYVIAIWAFQILTQLLRSRCPLPYERPTDPGAVPSAAIGHKTSSKFFAGTVDCCSSTRAICPLLTDHVRSGRTHNPFTPSSGPRPPACAVTRRSLHACLKSVVMC